MIQLELRYLNTPRVFVYDRNDAFNETGKDYNKENYWKYPSNEQNDEN